MIRQSFSIPELKMIVQTSIRDKVLSEDIYIDEITWYEKNLMYSYINDGYGDDGFSITNIQRNKLYHLGQILSISGKYFLFLDDCGNVHLHEDNLHEHRHIHALVSNSNTLTDEIFTFAAV